jgi:hypothetical protein
MGFHGAKASEALYKELDQKDIEEISAADAAVLEEKKKAIDKFFADRIDAKYKLEVQFGQARSSWKPFPGFISFYLSGTKLHGGGDEKLYLCPDREQCQGIIYPTERLGATVMCRACEMMWDENKLIGELAFNLTAPDWATAIHKLFVRFEHKADIYLKYHPEDIRYKTVMEMARNRGGEAINEARAARGLHIYPLQNIIKDTSAGAQLYDRFLAFIRA